MAILVGSICMGRKRDSSDMNELKRRCDKIMLKTTQEFYWISLQRFSTKISRVHNTCAGGQTLKKIPKLSEEMSENCGPNRRPKSTVVRRVWHKISLKETKIS